MCKQIQRDLRRERLPTEKTTAAWTRMADNTGHQLHNL